MAIFGAIPMPKSGMDVFSSGVDEMLKDMMQRQKMGQQQGQFNRTLAQQQLQHQDSMGLQRAAAARAAQAAADAHARMDPMYEINQYKALEDWVRGQQGGQPQQTQQPMPTQEMGEGMGMFSPEGMQEAQQQPAQQPMQSQGGLDMEMLKSHPMLRGFAKKHLGFDPMASVAQTPQEKQAQELETYRKKLEIKSGAIGDNVPLTGAMKTKLQGVVTGVDNSLPVIKDLIEDFKNLPTGMEFVNPADYAAYNAKANAIIEPLINAFGLNVTDATKDMMHDQVFRKTNEPLEKYRNRLIDLAKEIIRRRDDSFKSLESGAINPKSDFTGDSFENLKNETKVINGKTYTKINGEWHE